MRAKNMAEMLGLFAGQNEFIPFDILRFNKEICNCDFDKTSPLLIKPIYKSNELYNYMSENAREGLLISLRVIALSAFGGLP
jgi:hypothetical protein